MFYKLPKQVCKPLKFVGKELVNGIIDCAMKMVVPGAVINGAKKAGAFKMLDKKRHQLVSKVINALGGKLGCPKSRRLFGYHIKRAFRRGKRAVGHAANNAKNAAGNAANNAKNAAGNAANNAKNAAGNAANNAKKAAKKAAKGAKKAAKKAEKAAK
jgi:hypothetical protein